MRYNKPAIDIADQIKLLESRGLTIKDKAMAEHFLSNISYYRLAGYWWPLQSDKVSHTFKAGSTFEAVIDLYNFDRELRLIVFNMIERIEIGIRTQMIYNLSIGQTPWWFENDSLFKSNKHWQDNLRTLDKEIRRSKEVFMQEHQRKYYADGRRPPAWKSMEVVSMGLLSKFYSDLKNNTPEKKLLAKNLKIGNHTFLTSWLRSITVVRNICAHHSRLWNRNLPAPPKELKKAALPWIDTSTLNRNKVYAVLCSMKYLLHTISPGNHFTHRLQKLFSDYPNIDPAPMGFPKNWQNEPLWKI